jgi:Flp pilus assembly pilin Flp
MASPFADDQDGATMVEMTLVISILLVVVLGFVDFGNALYQWNQAAKAVQVGARLAAVSTPPADGLKAAVDTLNEDVIPGDPSESFSVECDGGTSECSSDELGDLTFDDTNFSRIIDGGSGDRRVPGMRDIFPRIDPENVVVRYDYSGLGYASRPGGPIPTITVRLQGLTFEFFFLGDLLSFTQLQIPAMTGTVTGEDLCTSDC